MNLCQAVAGLPQMKDPAQEVELRPGLNQPKRRSFNRRRSDTRRSFGMQAKPPPQAASSRSTSLTRSLRWNGLLSTEASLGASLSGLSATRGKAGDEHHLEVRIELGGAPCQLDAVHFGHDDIAEQQRERLLAQPLIGRFAVVERNHLVAGVLQRAASGTGACRYRLPPEGYVSSLPELRRPARTGARRCLIEFC